MNKKLLIVLYVILGLLTACSKENNESKTESPHQNKIDSLSLVKKNKAIEAGKLKLELDSLKKHLDSIKAIPVDSVK